MIYDWLWECEIRVFSPRLGFSFSKSLPKIWETVSLNWRVHNLNLSSKTKWMSLSGSMKPNTLSTLLPRDNLRKQLCVNLSVAVSVNSANLPACLYDYPLRTPDLGISSNRASVPCTAELESLSWGHAATVNQIAIHQSDGEKRVDHPLNLTLWMADWIAFIGSETELIPNYAWIPN